MIRKFLNRVEVGGVLPVCRCHGGLLHAKLLLKLLQNIVGRGGFYLGFGLRLLNSSLEAGLLLLETFPLFRQPLLCVVLVITVVEVIQQCLCEFMVCVWTV